MKTNIATLDFGKLYNKIFEYENSFPIVQTSYLFMNEITFDVLIDKTKTKNIYETMSYYSNSNGLIAKFEGHKVFIDNTLNFGDIEIR